jgi:oxygen-independent coproporphyrinogen-3 oxidase
MPPYSLYLHIPFCRHRCGYCDFNTYAGLDDLIPDYVSALCQEARFLSRSSTARLAVQTIFFGGGTPSLLAAASLAEILAELAQCFEIPEGTEITLEANPGTLSLAYMHTLRAIGINRLSLGMQSASPEELRLLERQHGFGDVVRAVTWARQAGFQNLNLDLIFGLPEQTLESWQRSLELALGLNPEHLSLYALTLEHGTPLEHWAARGLIPLPDPDLAAEMYEHASRRLEELGYIQYEISNWAKVDSSGQLLACQHNLQYWRNLPYLGLGAGAHGYAADFRTANVLSPARYIRRMSAGPLSVDGSAIAFPVTPATLTAQPVDRQAEIGETMLMGLRLVEQGVSRQGFRERFNQDLDQVFSSEIEELISHGLLEWAGDDRERLRLTRHGRLLGNQVFMRFI